jgi:diaminopimelate epimerase
MQIPFIKMHGTGNDFILIDCRERPMPDPEAFSSKFCRRRFGIGADQVLLLGQSAIADFKMEIFNADGSRVEMCGNGIRCLAKYVWEKGLSEKPVLDIETLAGIIRPERAGSLIRVNMGEPVFEPKKIPADIKTEAGRIIDYPLAIKDREFRITCVSMGNPHAVIFLNEDVTGFPVERYGPDIEKHPLFPRKTNVEFITLINRREVRMRVWERGSGETLACGTGASAAGVASMLKGFADREVTIHLMGGDLIIEWNADNHVYMTGPAVEVFSGIVQWDV